MVDVNAMQCTEAQLRHLGARHGASHVNALSTRCDDNAHLTSKCHRAGAERREDKPRRIDNWDGHVQFVGDEALVQNIGSAPSRANPANI
jgi:hypothetical protein